MEHWWEVAIGVAVVVLASLLFDFAAVPTGAGKVGVYLSAAFLPTLVVQYKKVSDSGTRVATGPFVFALVLNTFLVLTFAMIVLVLAGRF